MPFSPGFELITWWERLRRKIIRCHCLLRLLAEGIAARPAVPEPKRTFAQRILRPRYDDKLSPCQLCSARSYRSAVIHGSAIGLHPTVIAAPDPFRHPRRSCRVTLQSDATGEAIRDRRPSSCGFGRLIARIPGGSLMLPCSADSAPCSADLIPCSAV